MINAVSRPAVGKQAQKSCGNSASGFTKPGVLMQRGLNPKPKTQVEKTRLACGEASCQGSWECEQQNVHTPLTKPDVSQARCELQPANHALIVKTQAVSKVCAQYAVHNPDTMPHQ